MQVLLTKKQYLHLVKKSNQQTTTKGKTVSIGEVIRDIVDVDIKKDADST
jgi:hypothetical protein